MIFWGQKKALKSSLCTCFALKKAWPWSPSKTRLDFLLLACSRFLSGKFVKKRATVCIKTLLKFCSSNFYWKAALSGQSMGVSLRFSWPTILINFLNVWVPDIFNVDGDKITMMNYSKYSQFACLWHITLEGFYLPIYVSPWTFSRNYFGNWNLSSKEIMIKQELPLGS